MAIHQKLQAKLSQKLILTPSLQQAIKLLPMSTLELADMLNQEVVENPLLEEIPTEGPPGRRSPAGHRQGRRAGRPAGDGRQDRQLGRQRLRVLLQRLHGRRLPVAGAHRGQGAPADREHAVDQRVADRSPRVAAVADHRRPRRSGHRHGDHRQPRRRRLPRRLGQRDRADGPVADRSRRADAAPRPGLRPDRGRGPRPAGVPDPAAPSRRPRGHAHRADRHRAPAAAAEPPDPRAVAQDGPLHRRAAHAHRGHPPPRSQARRALQRSARPNT